MILFAQRLINKQLFLSIERVNTTSEKEASIVVGSAGKWKRYVPLKLFISPLPKELNSTLPRSSTRSGVELSEASIIKVNLIKRKYHFNHCCCCCLPVCGLVTISEHYPEFIAVHYWFTVGWMDNVFFLGKLLSLNQNYSKMFKFIILKKYTKKLDKRTTAFSNLLRASTGQTRENRWSSSVILAGGGQQSRGVNYNSVSPTV